MNDYEIEEGPCPHCGNSIVHVRQCDGIFCEDGWIDEYNEDPINFAPGDSERECEECHGTGWQRWCPACGKDVILDPEPATELRGWYDTDGNYRDDRDQ